MHGREQADRRCEQRERERAYRERRDAVRERELHHPSRDLHRPDERTHQHGVARREASGTEQRNEMRGHGGCEKCREPERRREPRERAARRRARFTAGRGQRNLHAHP